MAQPVVIITRHPDFENEVQVFGGDVNVIDIDLGNSFDTQCETLSEWESWSAYYAATLGQLILEERGDAAAALARALLGAKPDA